MMIPDDWWAGLSAGGKWDVERMGHEEETNCGPIFPVLTSHKIDSPATEI